MATEPKARKQRVTPAKDKLAEFGIEAVCERIADCQPLHAIAAEVGVSKGSLIDWLTDYPDHYARAKEAQAEKMAEDILAIADEECTMVRGEDGAVEVVFDSVAVQRNRLRVDARKWLAAKMAPKRFGDRVQNEISGPDGGPILLEQIAANPKSRLQV